MKRPRLSSSALAAALVATVACSAPSKGALVLAISTDMQTPKDINVVSVFITIDSVVKFDYLGRVLPDGTVALPATLAIVQQTNPNAQVRIRVIAFEEQTSRVLRDVLTTIPQERTSLLRVPLNFLDDGSGTGTLPANLVPLAPGGGGAPEGDTTFDPDTIASSCDFSQQLTSINGVCTSAVVSSATLPDYDPTEVYGTGGLQTNGTPASCFDVQTCFAQATPVTGLDTTACQFTLGAAGKDAGGGASALTADAGSATTEADASVCTDCKYPNGGPQDGGTVPPPLDASVTVQDSPAPGSALPLNVALVTPDTGACIAPGECIVPLENDAASGWTIAGSVVTLAPGICAKVKAGATLAVAQGTCPSKQLSDAVCEPTSDTGITEEGDSGAGGAGNADALTNYCTSLAACSGQATPDSGAAAGPIDAGAVASCVPLTSCGLMGYDCGYAGDGCGGVINCGTCTGPDYCGGAGFDRCGSVGGDASEASCGPSSCADQGLGCGLAGDGCGNVIDCGTCTAPETCGGGGSPSQCGG